MWKRDSSLAWPSRPLRPPMDEPRDESEPESDLSRPGEPSPGEIRLRAKVIARRAIDVTHALAGLPFDDVTACALVAVGASWLALPSSTIDPQYRDAVHEEMKQLGESMAHMVVVRLAAAREAKR